MATIYFHTLGCDKNTVDAEIMAAKLETDGHMIASRPDAADIVIVNTCSFIESAREDSIWYILRAIEERDGGTIKAVIVTGCLAERYREKVASEFPEVDAIVGLSGNADICAVVDTVLCGQKTERYGSPADLILQGERHLLTASHYAYLKIAEGCDNHCTFCAIPKLRGRYRSRSHEEILAEAKNLAARGVKELILIAQDTTSYGLDLGKQGALADLLDALSEIEAFWKIRVLYAYPDHLDDKMIAVMAKKERIAHYIDIPFQHANETLLRRMGRHLSQEDMRELVERLKRAIPDIAIRSSFIVGFPGETEDQFIELCEFLRIGITRGGCFTYSREEGTPAYRLPSQIDDETKLIRKEQFDLFHSALLAQRQKSMVGKIMEVICDGPLPYDEDALPYISCRTEYDAPEIDLRVLLPIDCGVKTGDILKVEITDTDDFNLFGHPVCMC